LALLAQLLKGLIAVDGLNAATLYVIVAAIQHVAHLGQLCEVSGHRVFDELIRRTASRRGKLLETRFGFRLEVHYHSSQFREAMRNCQSDFQWQWCGHFVAIKRFMVWFSFDNSMPLGVSSTFSEASYYRARYYDPSVGRFLNEDRTEFEGGINFYAYALNHPSNLVDPRGLNGYTFGPITIYWGQQDMNATQIAAERAHEKRGNGRENNHGDISLDTIETRRVPQTRVKSLGLGLAD
jgi:RHS repeat-associated protein